MVRRVFHFVYREVRGLHQAAYILALFTLGSQVLALVRDRLFAHTFGAGSELDVYYAAFRIPDLLFVLFASVLSVYVLLPFVTGSRRDPSDTNENQTTAVGSELLSSVFSVFLIGYVLVALVLAWTAPWYVPIVFPGFVEFQAELILLQQILLLQPLLLGLSNLW
jgi:putative peptidoglycan lipid II flippase